MNKSDSIKNIAIAMCKAQSEMGGAHKGANNPFFKSKYADFGSVIEVVKQPFGNNGLSYVQFPINDGDKIGVETILMHESGEWLSNSFTVKATKQDAQGAGSVITYCKRYGLQAVAGIPSEQPTAADMTWVNGIKNKQTTLDAIDDIGYRAYIQGLL